MEERTSERGRRGTRGVGAAATTRLQLNTRRRGTVLCRRAASLLVVALALTGALAAQGARAGSLILDVSFNTNDTITVTLPDGTPLGVASGPPTVIPAGFYTLELSDLGQIMGPQLDVQGPGVSLVDNMFEGEETTASDTVDFQPSSTYTWRNDQNPSAVFTFMTSGAVVGTPAGYASSSSASTTTPTVTAGTPSDSQPVVGSAVAPNLGTLTGAVSAKGKLTFVDKGKPVTSLTAGKYTVTVTDASKTSGFTIQPLAGAATQISGVAFVGKRSQTVTLTKGQWVYYPTLLGKKTFFVVVS